MQPRLLLLSALASSIPLLFTGPLCRADERSELAELPAAVQKTAHEQIGKSKIEEVEATFEAGQHATEVEYTEEGKKMAVVIGKDGTLIQKEHRLSPGDAPESIQKAVAAQFPGGKISHIQEVERSGERFFEVAVKAGGKSHQLKLESSGKTGLWR